MAKVRLDVLMVERGLAESRAQAQRLVMAGQVRVDGQVVIKAGAQVPGGALLEVDHGPPFVSRGGEKLEAALATFYIDPHGRVCADVGASTGGFSDCLLQNGAARVYAIDVGQGILHWKLRQDPRVVVMESTNARYVALLPEPVSLVTIDASFISLKVLLPVVKNWFPAIGAAPHGAAGEEARPGGRGDPPLPAMATTGEEPGPETARAGMDGSPQRGTGEVIALVKPQFEAGRRQAARGGGVIRDPAIHRQVLEDVLASAKDQGYTLLGLIRSPLLGPKGNVEFLAWLGYPAGGGKTVEELVSGLDV